VAPQRDETFKQKGNYCVQHTILQKFTNFHAIRSWSFQNICNETHWPRFFGPPCRCYIVERFQLFHVVVEGPMGCLLLVGISCDVEGSWDSQKLPKFSPMGNACATYYTARPIWTKDGPKRVIPRKDRCAFYGREQCFHKFWELNPQILKIWAHE